MTFYIIAILIGSALGAMVADAIMDWMKAVTNNRKDTNK